MNGHDPVRIHPTADVSPAARIGAGTVIWNNAQIRENAVLGPDCSVAKDVYIDTGVVIGERVKIQNGVSVFAGVTVEDDVFLGPHMTFTNDRYPRAFNTAWQIVPTLVRRGASIGANATVVCGTVIGEYAMVGAGCLVSGDVPAHTLVLGNPMRVVGHVCRCGRRLPPRGVAEAAFCAECGAATEHIER